MAEIDEILSGKQPEKAEPQPEVKPEASATDEQPRDEQGRFAPKPLSVDEVAALEKQRGQPVVAAEDPIEQRRVAEAKAQIEAKGPHLTPAGSPPAPEATPSGHIPIGAFVDMRLEAREAKRRAEAAERQLAELQKPKPEPVDIFADPDGWAKQHLGPLQSQHQQEMQDLRRELSEARAMIKHGPEAYEAMEAELQAAIEAGDPEIHQLRTQALTSRDPAAVAMQWYENRPKNQEARILAKYGLGPDGKPVQQPASNGQAGAQVMPSNLAAARNVGTRSSPAWAGPSPLKDIFSRPRK